jgi:hypothetical protein
MKIAVQNPSFLLDPGVKRDFSVAFEFIKLAKPAIFLTQWSLFWVYSKRLKQLGLNPLSYRFLLSEAALNRHADLLISFNDVAQDSIHCPISRFKGFKIAHLSSFHRQPQEVSQQLEKAGVDYLWAHGDFGGFSPLFRQYFTSYEDRFLVVPHSFSPHFQKRRAFDSRQPRCAISVCMEGPVCMPQRPGDCHAYYHHYSPEDSAFPWLETLKKNAGELSPWVTLLPAEDLIHNRSCPEAAQLLNDNMLFAADSGLFGAPSSRVFDGIAAGALMIAPRHRCFIDLGFEDGVNCLFHEPGNIEDFKRRLVTALANKEEMGRMANAATHWVHDTFSAPVIASWLLESLQEVVSAKI